MSIEVLIDVTQEDIDAPRGCTIFDCMVARAIKRALPGKKVFVGIAIAYVGGKTIELHQDTASRISDWAMKLPVEPFSFTLTLPDV